MTGVRVHCSQVWLWQDEWSGLTMADVEAMELETQRKLAALFGQTHSEDMQASGVWVGGLSDAAVLVGSASHRSQQTIFSENFI
jgi:hypothetical protein